MSGARLADLTVAAATAKRLFLPPSAPAIPPPLTAAASKVVDQGRHNYLIKVMARYLHKGIDDKDELLAILHIHNAKHCSPPKPDAELLEIVEWAVKKTAAKIELIGFTLEDLLAPVREEKYLLPRMVPTEAYTLIAGALSSFKTMLLLNMIVLRATGYDLLGLCQDDLTGCAKVGEPGPCVLASYEDTDWRIFARLQKILNAAASKIRLVHGPLCEGEFLHLAVKNIRRIPLTGQLGMTLVTRAAGYIIPNYAFIDQFRAAIQAFTLEGVLIGLDPLRLAIAGSQNDDDGADVVVQILNQLSVTNPDSGMVVISHTTKATAKDSSSNGYTDASYATSGSALFSQHARSNFWLARLKSDEIQKQFTLNQQECDRQTVARLTHGRLSHGVESRELYVRMNGGLLVPIAARSAASSTAQVIDRVLPLVAGAIDRLLRDEINVSDTALVNDETLSKNIARSHKLRDILKLLHESGFLLRTGQGPATRTTLTDAGRRRLAELGTIRNDSSGGVS
jgi:hypothetical protein